jgi:hypothetical protein
VVTAVPSVAPMVTSVPTSKPSASTTAKPVQTLWLNKD